MSGQEPKILILDDDVEMRALLQRYLSGQGFVVRAVNDAQQLDKTLAREGFDVLVLDLMMPGEDGLSICRRLRTAGETIPIVMLTAKGDLIDRILGLEMGADDYLPKPFEPRELAARLHAILRRQSMFASGSSGSSEVVRFGGFTLDISARRLLYGDQPVELTSGEFTLLRALAVNPGRTLGRERLIELAHGRRAAREQGITERSIDVQILRLRRLIEKDPKRPNYIQTVWGAGYIFVPDGGNA